MIEFNAIYQILVAKMISSCKDVKIYVSQNCHLACESALCILLRKNVLKVSPNIPLTQIYILLY